MVSPYNSITRYLLILLLIITNNFHQKKTIIISIVLFLTFTGLVTVFIINFYTGLLLYKHYQNCDPLKSGLILGKDELLPFYIMDIFYDLHLVNGLFVAGIFAASLGYNYKIYYYCTQQNFILEFHFLLAY